MLAHPRTVGGAGRLSTRLTESGGGALVAKGGAEGLECCALTRDGIGLVVKAEDGAERGLGSATIALLDRLDVFSAPDRKRLEDAARPVVLNHAKQEVGVLEAAIRILDPARVAADVGDPGAVAREGVGKSRA